MLYCNFGSFDVISAKRLLLLYDIDNLSKLWENMIEQGFPSPTLQYPDPRDRGCSPRLTNYLKEDLYGLRCRHMDIISPTTSPGSQD